MKTEIKLITKRKFTVGDATSFYDAKFVENPTLGEFVQWLKKNNPEEWGKVLDKGRNQIVEYRWGGIIGYCDKYEEIKDKVPKEDDSADPFKVQSALDAVVVEEPDGGGVD